MENVQHMSKREVCQLLINDYEKNGKEMSAIQLIIACGETDPVEILEGHKLFQMSLLNQVKKKATHERETTTA